MTDRSPLLKPTLFIVSAILFAGLLFLAANGLVALVQDRPAATVNAGQTGTQGQNQATGQQASGVRELPAQFQGLKWYEKELRDQALAFRNATAGTVVEFDPKKLKPSTLPDGKHRRKLIKYGRRLFANTSALMPKYTGTNRMSCANCHGGGALPTTTGIVGQDIDMIPLVGTAAGYPEWTGRTQRMRDMRQRIMGCFLRSMNAANSEKGVPAYTSREIQAMSLYVEWLGQGTPIGRVPYWRHLEKPEGEEKTAIPKINPVRGAKLYLKHCASCHGKDGQGTVGRYPPLWGPNSYNDGAGMGRIYTSAAFIREAMPYGYAHTLTDWDKVQDIAGFVNAHKRPHLPRQPLDWRKAGAPDEGVYYKRVQQRFGYEMNPMTKKLLIAGIPIGTEPLNRSEIPENVARYDQPLRNVSVQGSWKTTWLNESNTYENWYRARNLTITWSEAKGDWVYRSTSGDSSTANETNTNTTAALSVRAVSNAMSEVNT
ncbi:MAG: c-type cytochrome [Halodesulfurarchaeum sp.]